MRILFRKPAPAFRDAIWILGTSVTICRSTRAGTCPVSGADEMSWLLIVWVGSAVTAFAAMVCKSFVSRS